MGSKVQVPVTSYREMLPSLGEKTSRSPRETKLGRTASALEVAKAAARAEGFAQGLEEGRLSGRAEGFEAAKTEEMARRKAAIDRFATELNQIGESVLAGVYDWFRQSEESLAALAMLTAARIIAREPATAPDSALSIAREAIADVTHAESARIRVNPFSAPALEEHKAELMAVSPSLKGIQIVDDPSILGGCVIESAGGVIDATLETRIASILNDLREHYAGAAEDAPALDLTKRKRAPKSRSHDVEAA